MKNKKGFTLVELLATIVILGIILVIAVGKIVNAIDTSRRGAFSSTNAMIMNAVKRKASIDSLASSTITPTLYTFTDGVVSPSVEINGVLPDSGTMEINENGQVQIWTKNDRYCALKRFDESEITIFDREDRLCNIVVEVTLRVNPNGGTYNGVSTETTYSVEPDETQEVGEPEWAYHRFDGWTFTADSGTFESGVFTASISDALLTAEWTEYVALTLVSNGGILQPFNASYAPGTQIILTDPTKTNYTFTSWTASGTGASVTGSVIKTLTIGTGDTTLTANFEPTEYGISYILDGGTPTETNPDAYTIESDEIKLNNPEKPGYTFTGWTGSNGEAPQMEVIIPVESTGSKSYTANYTKDTYTIGYNLAGGTVSPANRTDYQVDTTTFTLTNPTKLGYTFTGWTGSNSATPQTTVTITTGSVGNKSYTANWDAIFTYVLTNGNTATAGTHYEFIADTARCASCWRIKFYASGTFTPLSAMTIDTFLVGGGGGSGAGFYSCGGGGGYTKTYTGKQLTVNTGYGVTVGAGGGVWSAGGSTSGFGYAAVSGGAGGGGAGANAKAGNGGSGGGGGHYNGGGGAGGSYGNHGGYSCTWASDGQSCSYSRGGGRGQLQNTCEFSEGSLSGCTRGTAFAYSGGGGGGIGGGGAWGAAGTNGRGGGGGGSYAGTNGGSGVVVIRNRV